MKKFLIGFLIVLGLVTLFVLVVLWVGPAKAADLPCGFQRLADKCMTYEPDKEGLRGNTFTWTENEETFFAIIGYKEGSYVGFMVGGKDKAKYPPIAIIYDIPSGSYTRIFLLIGETESIPKEFACDIVETFLDILEAIETPVIPKGTDV